MSRTVFPRQSPTRHPSAFVLFMLASITMLGTLFIPLSVSAEGKSDQAALCQGDGYLEYTDADGRVFENVGACVSYVAQGNDLVPVVVASLSIVYVQIDEHGGNVTFTGVGLVPLSAIKVVVSYDSGGSNTAFNFADADGNYSQVSYFSCLLANLALEGDAANGTLVSASVDTPC